MHTRRQKIIIATIWVLIFLVGIGVGFGLGRKYSEVEIRSAEDENFNKVIGITENKEENDWVGEYKVIWAIDGDTIEIEGGERVRYIGIDTPETVDPEKPVECFGKEATAENKKLTEGKTVRLKKDITNRDKYGRLLRFVFVGDDFINLKLVQLGFARSATYPPDLKYQAEFLQAEREAKESKKGLWSACF